MSNGPDGMTDQTTHWTDRLVTDQNGDRPSETYSALIRAALKELATA